MSIKETITKKLFTGIFVAGAIALGAIWGSCGEDNCSVSEMKSCSTSEDCVLVTCGCCHDATTEAVSKDCTERWYKLHDCQEKKICPAIYCDYLKAYCENNQCVAK